MLELLGSIVVAVPAAYTRYMNHLGVAARVVKQVVFHGLKTVVESAAAEHIRHLGWHGHRRQAGRARPPSDPPKIVIKSINTEYQTYERDAEEVNIIGRVIWLG